MPNLIRRARRAFGSDAATDILGGMWLVTLLLALLQLPAFLVA